MHLLTEAGIFGWAGLVLFGAGLVLLLRDPGKAGARSRGLAAAEMALGLLGAGLGQRLVAQAVEKAPDLSAQVRFLNLGTMEATANLILGGLFALAILGLGAGIGWARSGHGDLPR
jgi:hypothetical protein